MARPAILLCWMLAASLYSSAAAAQAPLTLVVASNNNYQSPRLCATSCFAVTYIQSTVPFFSFDTPHAVTLSYTGERAFPRPFFLVDVLFGADSPPVTEYWLDVTVNGAPAAFVNGNSGRIYFQGSSSSVRLGGQIDASALTTGVYPMTITVTAVRPGGNEVLVARRNELMIVNQNNSPIAAGWTLAEVQRLYFPAIGGYMVVEGDGTAHRLGTIPGSLSDYSEVTFDGTQYTRTYPNGTRVIFDQAGLHRYTIDRRGRQSRFLYNGTQVWLVEGPAQALGLPAPYHVLAYNAFGLATITEVSQGGPNRVTGITVDGSRKLTRFTDPDSHFTEFGYDGSNRLSTVTDRRGGVYQYVYHPGSWLIAEHRLPQVPIDAGGGNTSPAQPVITFDPWQTKGVPTFFTSSGSPGQPAVPSSIIGTVTDPEGAATAFSVNSFGQPTTVTDPLGRNTVITYDGTRPTLITRFDGSTDSLAWNGALLSWMRPAGAAAQTFTYGVFGQLQQVSGLGTRTETRYLDPANGNIDSIRYEAAAQPPQVIRYFYNATSKALARIVDAQQHETSFDQEGTFVNVERIVAPGNRVVNATFDSYGRLRTVTPAGRPQQTFQYDAINNMTHAYDGVNAQPIVFTHDRLFQISVTDQKSQVYASEHNALGWPTRTIDPLGAATTFRYDRRSLVKSTTNRRGQRVDMAYDNLGRILSKTGANTSSDYFSYSWDGRITVAWNLVARDSMFYDPVSGTDSTVTRLQSPGGEKRFRIYHSNSQNLATADIIDIASNTGITFPQRTYNWDATTGALSSFTFSGHPALSFGYTTEQLRLTTAFPNNGGTRTESYTSLHSRFQSLFNLSHLETNFYRAYSYDDLGRISAKLNGAPSGTREEYSYDNLGRLTGRVTEGNCQFTGWNENFGAISTCNTAISTESFTYDQVGNRTDHGGVTGTGNRIQSFAGITFTHDADGNVTQKYVAGGYDRRYWWSAESRLDSVSQTGASKVRYDYDALGRPVRKWREGASDWVFEQLWVYDGDHRLVSLDASMNRVEEYAYAPGIDRPIATIRGNTGVSSIGYHVQDELGNIIGVIETSAYVSQANSYNAWGSVTETGTATNSRLFWKGLKWEGDVAGLYYMRNRWYDPETGRFMSEDPIGLAGGINMYTFANNDPINGWDPYGLIPCTAELEAIGFLTAMGSNGDWWCVPPAQLPPVQITGGGGDGGGGWPWGDSGGGNWTTAGPGGGGGGGFGGGGFGGGAAAGNGVAPGVSQRPLDPCSSYSNAPRLGDICRTVNGPFSSIQNQCTAACLADKWRSISANNPRPDRMAQGRYLISDHVSCYRQCGYAYADFRSDWTRRTGLIQRQYPLFFAPDLGWGRLW